MAAQASNRPRLSPEDVARRKSAMAGLREETGGGDENFIGKWHDEKEKSRIDLVIHSRIDITSFHRHGYRVLVERDAKAEGASPGLFLGFRWFTCHETNRWHKFMRFEHAALTPPVCPVDRLVQAVKARPDLLDRAVFNWSGLTKKDGSADKDVEITGAILIGDVDTREGRMQSFMAQQRRLIGTIPIKVKDKEVDEKDLAVKLAIESWKLGSLLLTAIDDAQPDYGDKSDPSASPAVYRWSYDPALAGNDKYKVLFRNDMEASERVWDLWMKDPPPNIIAAYDNVLRKRSGVELVKALEQALCPDVDLDLWGIMGVDPNAKDSDEEVPDEEGTSGNTSAAKAPAAEKPKPAQEARKAAPAPAPKATAARRAVVEEEAKPLPPGEPCGGDGGCGTFWPEGLRYCPGRFTDKNCRKADGGISKEDGQKEIDAHEARMAGTQKASGGGKPPPWAGK